MTGKKEDLGAQERIESREKNQVAEGVEVIESAVVDAGVVETGGDVAAVMAEEAEVAPEIAELYRYWLNRIRDCVSLMDTFGDLHNVEEVAELARGYFIKYSDLPERHQVFFDEAVPALGALLEEFECLFEEYRDRMAKVEEIDAEVMLMLRDFVWALIELIASDNYEKVSNSLSDSLATLRGDFTKAVMPVSFLPQGELATQQAITFGQEIYDSFAALYELLKGEPLPLGSDYIQADNRFVASELKAGTLEKRDELYRCMYRQKMLAMGLVEVTKEDGEFYIDNPIFQQNIAPYVKTLKLWVQGETENLDVVVQTLLMAVANDFPELFRALFSGDDGVLAAYFTGEERTLILRQAADLPNLIAEFEVSVDDWAGVEVDDAFCELADDLAESDIGFKADLFVMRSLKKIESLLGSRDLDDLEELLKLGSDLIVPVQSVLRSRKPMGLPVVVEFLTKFAQATADIMNVDVEGIQPYLDSMITDHVIGQTIKSADRTEFCERNLALMVTLIESLVEFARQYTEIVFAEDDEAREKLKAAQVKFGVGDFVYAVGRHATNEIGNAIGMYSGLLDEREFVEEELEGNFSLPEQAADVSKSKYRQMILMYRTLRAAVFLRACAEFVKLMPDDSMSLD